MSYSLIYSLRPIKGFIFYNKKLIAWLVSLKYLRNRRKREWDAFHFLDLFSPENEINNFPNLFLLSKY